MSLQSIIDICDSITINRRKMIGVQYARNEMPRVNETPTYNPWRLTLSTPSSLRYYEARQIIETLDTMDRRTPEVISFSNNPKLSWMFKYMGTLTSLERSFVTFSSFLGNQMTLNVSSLTTTTPTDVILEKGDIFSISGYPHPFTSTTRVLRGSASTVTVITHRPNIFNTTPTAGTTLNWGNDVDFNVFCPNMPTYKLTPGGQMVVAGQLVNNAVITFTTDFELYEYLPTT